jgi:hypothetical protein
MRRSTGTRKAQRWIYNNINAGVYRVYPLDEKGNLIRSKPSKTRKPQLSADPMPACIPMFDNEIDIAAVSWSDALAASEATLGFGMETSLNELHEFGDDWDSIMPRLSGEGSKE